MHAWMDACVCICLYEGGLDNNEHDGDRDGDGNLK
jgi:hypothetical protein